MSSIDVTPGTAPPKDSRLFRREAEADRFPSHPLKPKTLRARLAGGWLDTGKKAPCREIVRKPTRHRTIFISDTHLGTPGCQAHLLADFLRHNEAQTLFLVGDIIDGWRIARSWYWNADHDDVIQEILRKVRNGTRVIYVPGNHDEALRDYTGLNFAGVEMVQEYVHETVDGRRLLVLHGDQFDSVVKYAKWLAHLGDFAYNIALAANTWLNKFRRLFGLRYWSLSAYLKHKVKNAVEYIGNYERAVARAARENGVDGVVCGHIHHAEIRQINDILYCNDGDWVESCTALTEDQHGNLNILHWTRPAAEIEEEARRALAGQSGTEIAA